MQKTSLTAVINLKLASFRKKLQKCIENGGHYKNNMKSKNN